MPTLQWERESARLHSGVRMFAARRRRSRGATAVEFAVVLPVLLVLMLGIVYYGVILAMQQVLTLAAEEGARAALPIFQHPARDRRLHGCQRSAACFHSLAGHNQPKRIAVGNVPNHREHAMPERRAYAAGYDWRHPAFAFHSTAAGAVHVDGFGDRAACAEFLSRNGPPVPLNDCIDRLPR